MSKEVKRRVISLETKIEILDRLQNGERVVDVAKSYNMNEATIRTIRTNENTIRESVAAGNTTSMGTTSYIRNIAMEKMEKALMLWIEDQTQNSVPIDTAAIRNKALRIYEKIVEELPSSSSTEKKPKFLASHGWFERFKIRHSIHSLKLNGELASGDVDAAEEYAANFAEIIYDNSYTPDQVFNADETGLFWKKMPKRTYVSKFYKSASGDNAAKDSITILFCSNASEDYNMKPLVINKSPVTFTAKVIREGLVLGRKLGNHFIQNDTNVERALRFQRDINRCLAQYEELYKDLTKNSRQLLITDFFTTSQNVNISASNMESAQITSSDESELEPTIPEKRMRLTFNSDSDEG